MCSALNYLKVALDNLNVFSPNVRPLKAVDEKCLSHAHAIAWLKQMACGEIGLSALGAIVIGMRPFIAMWHSNSKSRDCARLLGVRVASC